MLSVGSQETACKNMPCMWSSHTPRSNTPRSYTPRSAPTAVLTIRRTMKRLTYKLFRVIHERERIYFTNHTAFQTRRTILSSFNIRLPLVHFLFCEICMLFFWQVGSVTAVDLRTLQALATSHYYRASQHR
jgi:hypothetical protein